MADRALGRLVVGGLRLPLLRHHRPAAGPPHLCWQLVLRGLHHRYRHGPCDQSCVAAGESVQILLGVFGRHRRHDPVVVRPQRGGFHPLGRLPRDDVLLRAQAGRAADLFLPPVHRALLGHHQPVYLGRPTPPALHRPAGLGANPRHGDVDHPAGALLGRHDQRHDDPLRRLA
ncbi:hypothetical protein D3C76_1189250 [compost metagenome]